MTDDSLREFEELAEEYYPGSKRKRRDPRPDPVVLGQDREWAVKPKIYKVNGVDTEFYAIGALAKALSREPVTIRMWIQTGIMPDARFRTPDIGTQKGRRLWTRQQIEGIIAIAAEEGVLSGAKIKNFSETQFTEKVIALMKVGA